MSLDGAAEPMLSGLRTAIASGALAVQRCGFFFDFDGTLAPIQDDPEAVEPAPGVVDRLAALNAAGAGVAIVSARPVDFLRSRFPDVPALKYFGLYGLEADRGSGMTVVHPSAEPYLPLIAELTDLAHKELPEGTGVEFKRLTLALHYRRRPQVREALETWAHEQATRHGLRLQAGRMVYELKPPTDRTKGTVMREETGELGFAAFFGDDLGDIPAFDTLAELAHSRPDFQALRVVVTNPETGDAVARHADLRLSSPFDVPGLLDQVVAAISPRS